MSTSYRDGSDTTPPTKGEIKNPVSSESLNHSRQSLEAIEQLLEGDIEEGMTFTEEDIELFSEESGDDQGIHYSTDPRVLVGFHLASNGIMSESPGFYSDNDGSPREALGEIRTSDELEVPRRIVQGAYSTALAIANIPDLLEEEVAAISAEHSSPVRYGEGDSDSINAEVNGSEIALFRNPEEENEQYANHKVLETAEDEIDYGLMAYCLAKGMGFEDRNGDVLLGFPEVDFTSYDRENLEDLKISRSLVGENEPMQEKMQSLVGDHVEVNIYSNVIEDQDGTKIMEYSEMDLQGVPYKEESNPFADLTESWIKMNMAMNPLLTSD